MRRKHSKIKAKRVTNRCPPKAKVGRSNRLECTTLTLPKHGQSIEIPQGFVVEERFTFDRFEPKRTLFLRRSDPKLFEVYLKSHRNTVARRRSA